MMFPGFRKTNHRAVAGFLLPFLAAGMASFFVLKAKDNILTFQFWIPFITIIPLILIMGLVLSITSLPFIEELGDKDYAYSGLVLNILFIFLYIFSVIYYLCLPPQ